MSRFDKALERARATSAAESGSFEVMLPEEAPPDDVFDAPWRVTENPPEAAKRLAHVPTPRLPGGHGTTLRLHADLAEKVVADAAAPRMVVEQFRKLAGSLHQWQLEHGAKVVMVMSAVSAEGKTLTALNLALTLSGSYRRRVLLLDCDLRRPMMHEALQVAAEPGIAETAATGTPVAPICSRSCRPGGAPTTRSARSPRAASSRSSSRGAPTTTGSCSTRRRQPWSPTPACSTTRPTAWSWSSPPAGPGSIW
jgi:hypothetical protein